MKRTFLIGTNLHLTFVKGKGCNVNEPSLGWLGVDLLWALPLSAESDCVCLYDISLINEFHYRVLMYRYLTDVAKNVTLFPIKSVFSATELALGLARDNSSNFRAALPRRNPFVGLDLHHLVYSRRIVRLLMRRRIGQKGRVLREPSSPARTVEFCLREPSSPARTVEFCATRRVLREPSSSVCENRRVLRVPSSPARTVEFCATRRVLRDPSSSVCENGRVLRDPSSPARTFESCANEILWLPLKIALPL